MAVEDKYTDSFIVSGKKTEAFSNDGSPLLAVISEVNVAAADDDGSAFRIIKDINPNLIPWDCRMWTGTGNAITGGLSYELGIYEGGIGGAAIDIDNLANARDFSSDVARENAYDGFRTISDANTAKPIYEIAGHTLETRIKSYDIVLTATDAGTGAGKIWIYSTFMQK